VLTSDLWPDLEELTPSRIDAVPRVGHHLALELEQQLPRRGVLDLLGRAECLALAEDDDVAVAIGHLRVFGPRVRLSAGRTSGTTGRSHGVSLP
jgi:hypothetical protein